MCICLRRVTAGPSFPFLVMGMLVVMATLWLVGECIESSSVSLRNTSPLTLCLRLCGGIKTRNSLSKFTKEVTGQMARDSKRPVRYKVLIK